MGPENGNKKSGLVDRDCCDVEAMVATMGVYDGAWRSNPYVLCCSGGGKRYSAVIVLSFFRTRTADLWLSS